MILSVIIVNWNSKEYVRRALASLPGASLDCDMEIIVVDNGSFDGCDRMLGQEFPEVKYIQLPENIGFGRANNFGVERASGEFVWLLNPDTEVVGEAAGMLLNTLRSRRVAGLTGARLLNSDGSLQTSCVQSLPTPLNQALDCAFLRRHFPNSMLWGVTALRSRIEPVEVEAVSGACMMLRRVDFIRVGGFEPRYFMYGEDMDLCHKIRKSGLKILYAPQAEVTHHGGGSSKKQPGEYGTVQMREAAALYFKGNFSMFHAGFYRVCMALSALVRVTALLFARLFNHRSDHAGNSASLRKWWVILKWCLGAERGTKTPPGEEGVVLEKISNCP